MNLSREKNPHDAVELFDKRDSAAKTCFQLSHCTMKCSIKFVSKVNSAMYNVQSFLLRQIWLYENEQMWQLFNIMWKRSSTKSSRQTHFILVQFRLSNIDRSYCLHIVLLVYKSKKYDKLSSINRSWWNPGNVVFPNFDKMQQMFAAILNVWPRMALSCQSY